MKCATKTLRIVLSTAILLGLAATAQADVATYSKTLQSTAWVLAKTGGETSSGTGVLIDLEKKLLVTNFHVVGDARATVIFFPEMKAGKPIVERDHYLTNVKKLGIKGQVLGIDRKRDLALIELDRIPEGVLAITMAKEGIGPGEDVQSVGNPGATDALWAYTSGTVRSVYKKTFRTGAGEHEFRVVETQSPINSGDSGGPVVNNAGELVAISQAISPSARLISYNVDISELREFIASSYKPAPSPAEELLKKLDMTYVTHDGGYFEVELEQKDKQKQSVYFTKEVEYYERADVRKIWSLAATLKEAPSVETSLKLLQQSARTKMGAWTLEKTKDGEYMVIYCCKLDATATPDVVKSTMEYVARLTSESRKELLPKEPTADPKETLDDWLAEESKKPEDVKKTDDKKE